MFRLISSLGKRVSSWTRVNEAAAAHYHKTTAIIPKFYCSSSDGPEDAGG